VIEKSRQIIRLTPPQESEPKTYLRQFHFMPEAQWNVNILTDIQSLKRDILINNILACSGLFLAFFCSCCSRNGSIACGN